MSIMGIGTNLLGYGNEEVDEAVRRTINLGNMSTLNCPEEVFLAEKLLDSLGQRRQDLQDLVKQAIAIRIARASSGKDKIALVDIMDGMIGI